MSLYTLFKTNESFETDGVWIEYGQNEAGDPIRIKIARAGGQNVTFNKALEKASRPYKKAIQMGTLDNKSADNIYKEVFAETVVLDWMNIEDAKGKPIEFKKENVLKLFGDLPDLFADLREQATDISIFREEVMEEDLGNSGTSSSTGSNKPPSNKK